MSSDTSPVNPEGSGSESGGPESGGNDTQSSLLSTARVGVVTGRPPNSPSESGHGLGKMLKLLDSFIPVKSLPLETESLPEQSRLHADYRGYLLNTHTSARQWLRDLDATAVVAAPFLTAHCLNASQAQASVLIWPFEDSAFLAPAQKGQSAAWIETTSFSSAGVESAARAAVHLASERSQRGPYWIVTGYEPAESFAYSSACQFLDRDLPKIPLELVSELLAGPEAKPGCVLLTLGRPGPPLSRVIGDQGGSAGWIGWSDSGIAIAQSREGSFSGLPLAFFLDRLGFAREARALEKIFLQVARELAPTDRQDRALTPIQWNSDKMSRLTERMIESFGQLT